MARAKVSNNFSSYMNTNDDIIKRTMRNDGIRLFALIIDLSFIFIQRILTIMAAIFFAFSFFAKNKKKLVFFANKKQKKTKEIQHFIMIQVYLNYSKKLFF